MAIKKSELYSTIWESCNKLRGGMDASQYKDYVLVVLFLKYISDKAKVDNDSLIELPDGCSFDVLVQYKNKSNIGEKFNEILEAIAEANPDLRNVITNADFCDEQKLGKGKDLVETVSGLIGVFQESGLDFSSNRESDDDLIGDAYEFLMKNFASQSGKSKGQFYTPAEVSRLIAKVIGIGKDERSQISIYDPTCGSGSLLLRAKAEAKHGVSVNGQEFDIPTIGMAKMNMILHGEQTADLRQGDTINDPLHYETKDVSLQQFDYVVANPPFSDKSWLKSAGEEDKYKRWGNGIGIGVPPLKCGDYAYLLHIIKSIKPSGMGACILPHGVLFRGNAEADIRKYIVTHHYIKGIIGLPGNLFFGTGIPACIIIIDKAHAMESKGIFMINASEGFAKDGAKNRLREQDIKRISDVWEAGKLVPHYARFVEYEEIERNEYNLNLPRYIEAEDKEVVQDIEAHLHGGLPEHDINQMKNIWDACPSLKDTLFVLQRKGYYDLKPALESVRNTISEEPSFKEQYEAFNKAVDTWRSETKHKLKALTKGIKPKELIVDVSESLRLTIEKSPSLVNGYDAYEQLMNYWAEVMQDDCYIISDTGWKAELKKPKDKKGEDKKSFDYTALECDLLPVDIVIQEYYQTERAKILELSSKIESLESEIEEFVEENSDDFNGYDKVNEVKAAYMAATCLPPKEGEKVILEMLLEMPVSNKAAKDARNAFINEHGDFFVGWVKFGKSDINKRLKEINSYSPLLPETIDIFRRYLEMNEELSSFKSKIKEEIGSLTSKILEKYPLLSEDDIKHLVVECKWMDSITNRLQGEMTSLTQQITDGVSVLYERYSTTLGETSNSVKNLEEKVLSSLKEMGFEL